MNKNYILTYKAGFISSTLFLHSVFKTFIGFCFLL